MHSSADGSLPQASGVYELHVVGDLGTYAEWLRRVLKDDSRCLSLFEFESFELFLLHVMREAAGSKAIKAVISEFAMEGISGAEAISQAKKLDPNIRIIMVGADPTARDVVAAWRAGACDFLLKPFTTQTVVDAVLRCIEMLRPLNSESADTEGFKNRLANLLTKRERQVLWLIGDGFSNAAIGKQLNLSLSTVKMHRSNLMRKLGVSSSAQLLAMYHAKRSDNVQ